MAYVSPLEMLKPEIEIQKNNKQIMAENIADSREKYSKAVESIYKDSTATASAPTILRDRYLEAGKKSKSSETPYDNMVNKMALQSKRKKGR